MLVFPNCKINIGLRITGKRPDGYHNLVSIFFPIPWYDALEIIEANETTITLSGIEVPGDTESNLCVKAWKLLKKDFHGLPAVRIYLHKTIPSGAGLGGGSSNGAFMLKALNEKFDLGLENPALQKYALQLGSDCPFFIQNAPALVSGRGENITPIELDLNGRFMALINPGIHINTGWAFSQILPQPYQPDVFQITSATPNAWKATGLWNDFEEPVSKTYPVICSILDTLGRMDADYASLTGTGSTCFGIFKEKPSFSEDFTESMKMIKVISL
jgi:4-diphosphocytidyl-2-C-methyl-D-erythritol kinase